MKITVKVEDRIFEVEIGDLRAWPIIATVEGEQFEVWPDDSAAAARVSAPQVQVDSASAPAVQPPRRSRRSTGAAPMVAREGSRGVYAPIPGVIESIAVRAGDVVSVGQQLCVLEAMKMKNIIRAARAGEIALVFISVGQHVKHNDLLFEYADSPAT
jgi:biotin carboxyl carrier protein